MSHAAPIEFAAPQLWWKRAQLWIAVIPVAALVIKLIVAARIVPVIAIDGSLQGGGWLGADGENYLSAVTGLLDHGIFSKEQLLTYWPAGYPILMWIFAKVSLAKTMWSVSIAQSLFFAGTTFYLGKQISRTKLAKYAIAITLLISLNPTLSLSSLVIGYESAIASSLMAIVALILAAENNPKRSKKFYAVAIGIFFAFAAFMQPRLLLVAALTSLIWGLYQSSRRSGAILALIVIAITSLSPALLIVRNIEAGKGAVISQNLGITMSIGAGDSTTGSYARSGPTVPCDAKPTDNQLVVCVTKWYLSHPVKGVKLFIHKSIYFWSPWSGPLQDGTMKRNPWHLINPLEKMSTSSYQGNQLVEGPIGKAISWIWLFGGISLFFIGFFWLRSMAGIYNQLAWLTALPVLAAWVISMGTIGDQRFRLPTLPLSIFLQLLGFIALRKKATTGTFAHIEP